MKSNLFLNDSPDKERKVKVVFFWRTRGNIKQNKMKILYYGKNYRQCDLFNKHVHFQLIGYTFTHVMKLDNQTIWNLFLNSLSALVLMFNMMFHRSLVFLNKIKCVFGVIFYQI
jgi:hypothetical protein